jgi:hypothetical protein
MTDSISNITAKDMIWKTIESAQLKIIREAFRLHYKKNNKFITEYAKYVKNLRQAEKSTAILLFPNEEAYNRRMTRYRNWYQGKKELLASIEYLYSFYYILSKEDRVMTEEEINKAIEEVISNEELASNNI